MRSAGPRDRDYQSAGQRGRVRCILRRSRLALAVCNGWGQGLWAAGEASRSRAVECRQTAATAALTERNRRDDGRFRPHSKGRWFDRVHLIGDSSMQPPAGTIGPYQILQRVGAGGMGEVFKARDSRLDRIVALKTSKDEFSDRVKSEARAAAALNHP